MNKRMSNLSNSSPEGHTRTHSQYFSLLNSSKEYFQLTTTPSKAPLGIEENILGYKTLLNN
jgi:hypothetical protein